MSKPTKEHRKRRRADDLGKELPPGVKLLCTLDGHKSNVRSVVFDPTGQILASGSDDNTVKLWELASGKLLHTLQGHQDPVTSVAFDSTGRILASGSDDNTVKLWESASGKLLHTLQGHKKGLSSVAFSPGDQILASGSDDNTVKLWELASGNLLRTLEGHQDQVTSVAFDSTGQILASGSADNTIKLWEWASGNLLRTLEGHQNHTYSVAFGSRGQMLASAGSDNTIQLWEWTTGKLLRTLEGHTGPVGRVTFSPDRSFLASESGDGTIQLWRCDRWEQVAVLPRLGGSYFYRLGLMFHPRLPVLAAASAWTAEIDNKLCKFVHLWELDHAVLLRKTPAKTSGHYRNAKVVLVGNASVGKSGLGLVLSGRKYRSTDSTHGRRIWQFQTEEVEQAVVTAKPTPDKSGSGSKRTPSAGAKVTETRETYLWDLAGQPAYRLVHQLHLNEVAVALVVFDSRSDTDPFAGVSYWARALDQARAGFPLKKFLVAARIDRGGVAVSRERVEEQLRKFGFEVRFFETSARRGDGIAELRKVLSEAVPWGDLPPVTRTREFSITKAFLVKEKRKGTVVAGAEELFHRLRKAEKSRDGVTANVFGTCLRQLEATGLTRRLSFGDGVLLQPELLDDYVGWLTLAAREEPDGLGHLHEDAARAGHFPMDKQRELAGKTQEKTLLLAAVEETLARGLAIREFDEQHKRPVLVFPTELKEELPDYPGSYSLAVAFRFAGPVRGIYASLVVKLIYSVPFQRKKLFRNAAVFTGPGNYVCGVSVELADRNDDSIGRLTVFFEDTTPKETRLLFLRYVSKQISEMAFAATVERQRIYHCGECNYTIEQKVLDICRRVGETTVACPVCKRQFPLDDLAEQAARPGADIDTMESEAVAEQEAQSRRTVLDARRKLNQFHVFLCHNSRDKADVRDLARTLENQGVLPWLDEKKIFAGDTFQKKLEEAIVAARVVLLCIGAHGVGLWQEVEYFSAYQRFIERDTIAGPAEISVNGVRVIPVLFPGARAQDVPLFARQLDGIDLRGNDDSARREQIQKLVKAILKTTAE